MTGQELATIIQQVIIILQENQKATTPEVLALVKQIYTTIQANPPFIQVIADLLKITPEQITSLVTSLSQYENIEEQLVLTPLTSKLIEILTALKKHNWILAAIAALI